MNPPKLQRHNKHGYWYYPISQNELDGYYANSYSDPLSKPGDEIELQWKRETLWNDIAEVVRCGGAALDVGSGDGEFANYLRTLGLTVKTLDKKGNVDYNQLDDVSWDSPTEPPITTIVMLNTLEHVADPRLFLDDLRWSNVVRGGNAIHNLIVRVPNDFNKLQLELEPKRGKYWLHYPDHVSYFSIESLTQLLDDTGWKVVDTQCDYPMELFLLQGVDYIGDPRMGNLAHKQRRNMELVMSSSLRREMWRKFAEMGIGRNIIVYAERK